jgi:chitosanase
VITPAQKHVVDCIIAIFETGRVPSASAYSACTVLADGAGISYGKHQCTDKAGSLDLVVKKYIAKKGKYADEMEEFLPELSTNESTKVNPKGPYPLWLQRLMNLLSIAGADPVMHAAQDEVFDEHYFAPAANMCKDMGLKHALSWAVIYDTCIHSGPGMVANMRKKFAASPPSRGGDEVLFIKQYLQAREDWLKSHPNPLVQKTVYRMDAFQILVDNNCWNLQTPLTVRGVKIA